MAFSVTGFAQTRTITGKVTSASGEAIANASVIEKGTTNGTTTDVNGNYSLSVSGAARALVISAIGYAENEVSIAGRNTANATLSGSDQSLEEIVVVGYGTQKRKEITGNLATVRGDIARDRPVQTFDQALAGSAPGVQITMPNGVLNSAPVFRIRGVNSISLSSYPLIVVDGVPSFTGDYSSTQAASNPLASINPNDIESIEIAKDAAATAIFGSRAANGVLFVTTKKGKSGAAKVGYNGWVSFTNPFRLPDVMNANEYATFKNNAFANYVQNVPAAAGALSYVITKDAAGRDINTRWYDQVYRQGISHSHNINVSGGSQGTTYYFSAGYTDQQGIIQKNDFKRVNTLLNVDSRFAKIVSVGGKLSYSNERNLAATNSGSLSGGAFGTAGLGRLAIVLPPIISPYNNDGTLRLNGAAIGSDGNIVGIGSLGYYNPRVSLENNRENVEVNRVQSNAYLQIKPFSSFALRTNFGIDYMMLDNDQFWTPKGGDGYSYNGYAWAGNSLYKTNVWTSTAQWDPKIADQHTISLLGGVEQTWRNSHGSGINRQNLSDPDYEVVQAGFTINNPANLFRGQNYLFSLFSRLNYNFGNKYFLSGNIRQDEYSALGVKKGTFWGVSAGWELANEDFFSNNVFNSFRLRGSYGKVGNIGGIGDFSPYSSFGSGLYGGLATLQYSSVGAPDLRWETSKKLDVGINFGLLKDRIGGEITYYRNNIDGLILGVQQAPSTGLPSNPNLNVGSMFNKGWEFMVRATPVLNSDFNWTTNLNATFNKNEVTSLDPTLPYLLTATSGLETANRTQPGYPIGMLWVVKTDGVDPQTGKRIFLKQDGTRVFYGHAAPAGTNAWSTTADGLTRTTAVNQAADGVMAYSPHPKVMGGWDNTVRFKSIDLNALFTYQFGNYIYYGSNAGLHDQRWWNNDRDLLTESWEKPGDQGKLYPRAVYSDNISNGSSMPLDLNVFKGDFVKLRNLTLGYTFGNNLVGKWNMSSIRFYVSGQNLAVMTKYPGPDPEVSSNGNSNTAPGVDRNTAANARTVLVGLNVSF